MIVSRRGGLPVVQHGVEGHLEGDVDLAEISRQKTGGHGEAAPGAFPTHHDLCVVDPQLVSVSLQEKQSGVAVFQIGGTEMEKEYEGFSKAVRYSGATTTAPCFSTRRRAWGRSIFWYMP